MPQAPGPAPWPDSALARAIRAHPRATALAVAAAVMAVGLPALLHGLRELSWTGRFEAPVPATVESIANGSAFGEDEAGWFRVRARPFVDRAARAGSGGPPRSYVPVGVESRGKRRVTAVVETSDAPGGEGWSGRQERDFDVVARRDGRVPADVAGRLGAPEPGSEWSELPLLVDGAPDRRGAQRAAVLGGVAVALAGLAVLGAATRPRTAARDR